MSEPPSARESRMPGRVVLALVLSGLACLTLGFFVVQSENARFKARSHAGVLHHLSLVRSGLEQGLNSRLLFMQALAVYVIQHPDIDTAAFETFARSILTAHPDIIAVELARDNVISHVHPLTGNEAALGRDLLTLPPDQQEALRSVIRGAAPVIAGPVSLVQGGTGLIGRMPVLLPSPESPSETGAYWGLVIIIVNPEALFRQAGLFDHPDIRLAIRGKDGLGDAGGPIFGDQQVFAADPVTATVALPGGSWRLAAAPAEGWTASPRAPLLVGLCLAAWLIAGLSPWWLSLSPARFRQAMARAKDDFQATRQRLEKAVAERATVLDATTLKLREEIEARRKAEEIQRESDAESRRLWKIVEQSPATIIITDVRGVISYVNPHFTDLTGYDRADVYGRNPRLLKSGLHDDEFYKLMWTTLRSKRIWRGEVCNRKKNGELYWEDATISPVTDEGDKITHYVAVKADITDRKKAEETLRNSEAKLKLVTDNSADVIWTLDTDYRFTYISPSIIRLRGLTVEEALRETIAETMTPESWRRVSLLMAENPILSGHDATTLVEVEQYRKDGSTVWVECLTRSLLSADGHVVGILGISRDITERKYAEALKEDVDRITRHDLKTPLNAIINLPLVLEQDGNLDPTQSHYLRLIRESGLRMLRMINTSLDLYKMEIGAYQVQAQSIDLMTVVQDILNFHAPLIQAKKIRVAIVKDDDDADGQTPFIVVGEELLLFNLIENLLQNALEASPEGGTVVLNFHDHPTSLAIGNPGEVPPEIRDRFFEKYATYGKEKGTGLGTYSAALIARTLGGGIALDASAPGRTTVTVFFPPPPPSPA